MATASRKEGLRAPRHGPAAAVACALAVTQTFAVAGGAGAQGAPETASEAIEAAARSFSAALADASAEQMGELLAAEGIRLQLDGPAHAGLSTRQAIATLRDFLREYDGGSAVVARAAPVQGSPTRGFGEIQWSTRVTGTSQEVRYTLFIGLSRESDEWRIDEIRILR